MPEKPVSQASSARWGVAGLAFVVVGMLCWAFAAVTTSKRAHDVLFPEGMMFAMQAPWLLMNIGTRPRPARTMRTCLTLGAVACLLPLVALVPAIPRAGQLAITFAGIALWFPVWWLLLAKRPPETSPD